MTRYILVNGRWETSYLGEGGKSVSDKTDEIGFGRRNKILEYRKSLKRNTLQILQC